MNHFVVALSMDLRLYMSGSLKDKRRMRQKLVMRLKKHFNLSIKETANHDLLNYITLTAAYVAMDATEGEEFVEKFRRVVEEIALGEGELARYDWDMINYSHDLLLEQYGS